MSQFIAFLRAINVGGHTVKMDELRRLFETHGFLNVETFIASGNVVFDTEAENAQLLEKNIEKLLQEALDMRSLHLSGLPQNYAISQNTGPSGKPIWMQRKR